MSRALIVRKSVFLNCKSTCLQRIQEGTIVEVIDPLQCIAARITVEDEVPHIRTVCRRRSLERGENIRCLGPGVFQIDLLCARDRAYQQGDGEENDVHRTVEREKSRSLPRNP